MRCASLNAMKIWDKNVKKKLTRDPNIGLTFIYVFSMLHGVEHLYGTLGCNAQYFNRTIYLVSV